MFFTDSRPLESSWVEAVHFDEVAGELGIETAKKVYVYAGRSINDFVSLETGSDVSAFMSENETIRHDVVAVRRTEFEYNEVDASPSSADMTTVAVTIPKQSYRVVVEYPDVTLEASVQGTSLTDALTKVASLLVSPEAAKDIVLRGLK